MWAIPVPGEFNYSMAGEEHELKQYWQFQIDPTAHSIMSWISVRQPLISHSIKETDRLAIRGVGSIRTYFPAQPS